MVSTSLKLNMTDISEIKMVAPNWEYCLLMIYFTDTIESVEELKRHSKGQIYASAIFSY